MINQVTLHLLHKPFVRRVLRGLGATATGFLVVALLDAFSAPPSNTSAMQEPKEGQGVEAHPPAIFPARIEGGLRYFTVEQFAQTSAKRISSELPSKSAHLEGLTTVGAFSEGRVLHLTSVLDRQVSASEADLAVLEILLAIDHCSGPDMKMFFDASGQVVTSVFSHENVLLRTIILHKAFCEEERALRQGS